MSDLISAFTDQDFYSETHIQERINEWKKEEKRLLDKLKFLKKLKSSRENKFSINNTKSMLKNARLEIEGYQAQTLKALAKIKHEYKKLLTQIENTPKEREIPLFIEELKFSNNTPIKDFIDEIIDLKQSDSITYHRMSVMGFTLLPLFQGFDLNDVASYISEAQIYLTESRSYNERHGNQIIQILKMIEKGILATMVMSISSEPKAREKFLSYCKFAYGM